MRQVQDVSEFSKLDNPHLLDFCFGNYKFGNVVFVGTVGDTTRLSYMIGEISSLRTFKFILSKYSGITVLNAVTSNKYKIFAVGFRKSTGSTFTQALLVISSGFLEDNPKVMNTTTFGLGNAESHAVSLTRGENVQILVTGAIIY